MTTDVSFARRSLVSNENKYRESLEYRLFLAENPEFIDKSGMQPQQDFVPNLEYPSLLSDNLPSPRLAQTFDVGLP